MPVTPSVTPAVPDTRAATQPVPIGSVDHHEHGWRVESRHPTSDGVVIYVRCECGTRRVDRIAAGASVPEPVSRPLRFEPL